VAIDIPVSVGLPIIFANSSSTPFVNALITAGILGVREAHIFKQSFSIFLTCFVTFVFRRDVAGHLEWFASME